jgi:hypothetical protein
MSPVEWTRQFEHPYPPLSTFAVPFAWMLKSNQSEIEDQLARPLPPDEEAPFSTSWVFGRARQAALLRQFFGRLVPESSLVFVLYCEDGQPLGDSLPRLVVGGGRIAERPTYAMWDRIVRHSIRPDGTDGFLFPYHDWGIQRRMRTGSGCCERSRFPSMPLTCAISRFRVGSSRRCALDPSSLPRERSHDSPSRPRQGSLGGARGLAHYPDRNDLV